MFPCCQLCRQSAQRRPIALRCFRRLRRASPFLDVPAPSTTGSHANADAQGCLASWLLTTRTWPPRPASRASWAASAEGSQGLGLVHLRGSPPEFAIWRPYTMNQTAGCNGWKGRGRGVYHLQGPRAKPHEDKRTPVCASGSFRDEKLGSRYSMGCVCGQV